METRAASTRHRSGLVKTKGCEHGTSALCDGATLSATTDSSTLLMPCGNANRGCTITQQNLPVCTPPPSNREEKFCVLLPLLIARFCLGAWDKVGLSDWYSPNQCTFGHNIKTERTDCLDDHARFTLRRVRVRVLCCRADVLCDNVFAEMSSIVYVDVFVFPEN